MPSNYETFWDGKNYALVANSAKKPFPKISFNELKKKGVTVYAVDPAVNEIGDEKVYNDLSELPGPVDRVVLETPKEETKDWLQKAIDLGVSDVWVHTGRETDEAIKLAEENAVNLRTGTCAAMYTTPGFSFHSFHKVINKILGKY